MAELTREEAIAKVTATITSEMMVRGVAKRTQEGVAERLTIRPVELKGERQVQIATFDGRRTTTKNYSPDEFSALVMALFDEGFVALTAVDPQEEVSLTFSRKGRPLLTVRKTSGVPVPDLSHDRQIARLLPEGTPDAFLQRIGLMTEDGRIKADKQRKFRQINEFLRLVSEVAKFTSNEHKPLLIVDFGCGQAFLALALHHYLNHKLGLAAELIGVDRSEDLIRSGEEKAEGQGSIQFVASAIADFEPPRTPDVVVALHACDTATDDAIAKAIHSKAKYIFVAPCCHHHLQVQLAANIVPGPFRSVLREPIMRERLGDILTDTFRALLLRIAGYEVDLLEFTLPEHTPRNLMIRAKYTGKPDAVAEQEFADLKSSFQVTPYLEPLLKATGSPEQTL
jgi:hypothetical protein